MTDRAMRRGPVFVTDIHLDFSGPLADIPVPGEYTAALALVRLHGEPLATVSLPVSNGRIAPDVIAPAIVERAAEPILRHLLVDRLITHGSPSSNFEADNLLDTPHRPSLDSWPSVTAAVCTRGRPDDLERCLAALGRVDYPDVDLLVVDNAPADSSVADVIHAGYPRVRYVVEPRAGLDWARNRAILETGSEILAFTDDDAVVDAGWLKALVTPLAEEPDVMAVAGLVVPYELETEAQQLFERHGGLGRGFVRRWVRVPEGQPTLRANNVTTLGTGANIAFRRSLFDRVGGFDAALGAGTRSAAGDEIEMLFRVLKAGHTFVYDPSALVRHRHRRDYAAIRAQLRNWLMGTRGAAERTAKHYPDERMAILAFAARLLLLYFPRRIASAAFGSALDLNLVLSELGGLLAGRGQYPIALREADEIGRRFPTEPRLPEPIATERRSRCRRQVRKVVISVDEPLVAVPNADDAERVQVEILRSAHALGMVEIISGGQSLTQARLSHAIVSAHLHKLANVARFRHTLATAIET